MGKERIHPNVVVTDLSPHYYSNANHPRIIVIHSTESSNRTGKSDLQAIGSVFHTREASAQVCTDGEGQSARFVHDNDAAWACVAYNRVSLNIEQVGFAAQSSWPEAQVRETARWVAYWSLRHDVPIRKAWTVSGRVLRSGVTTHQKLGAAGGGHTDPGPNYPMGHMLDLARHYKKLLHK